jgi:hypothetical protein
MPLGIVSDDEFEAELIPPQIGVIQLPKPLGRPPGSPNIPDSLRRIITDNTVTDGRKESLELAAAFGIGHESVDSYIAGKTSKGSEHNPLAGFLSERKEKIAKKASKKLLQAMEGISQDKLDECSAPELAAVSRAMSGIIKDMLPEDKTKTEFNQAVQFVMYAPQIAKESSFERINVNEQ